MYTYIYTVYHILYQYTLYIYTYMYFTQIYIYILYIITESCPFWLEYAKIIIINK